MSAIARSAAGPAGGVPAAVAGGVCAAPGSMNRADSASASVSFITTCSPYEAKTAGYLDYRIPAVVLRQIKRPPLLRYNTVSRRREDLPTSQRAVDFVHMWISANVHANDIVGEKHDAKSKEYAGQKHAGLVGIAAAEIKESYDDLEHMMMEAIEKKSRQQIGRHGDGLLLNPPNCDPPY
jgi:hypothetical protein